MQPAPPPLFDLEMRRRRRARLGRPVGEDEFLIARAFDDVADRLGSVKRRFDRALFVGAGALTARLPAAAEVGHIISADPAPARVRGQSSSLVFEEDQNPFAPGSFDLIVSLFTLHSVNDPVGALIQHRQALVPDGLFIGVVLGGETLNSLRKRMIEIESRRLGGAAARFHPLTDVRGWGTALSRAGFNLVVCDEDRVEVTYKTPQRLFSDLRDMGETGVLTEQPGPVRPSVGRELFDSLAEVPATIRYDVGIMTGWSPHESQQKPAKRGSGTVPLGAALSAIEGTKKT